MTGSLTMPDSERLTRSACPAWSSIDRLRCSTPMPPWRAIAIAIRASVTVSIAADTSGTASEISRVSRVAVSASDGITSVSPGSSSTSSKVRPRVANLAGRPSKRGWSLNEKTPKGRRYFSLLAVVLAPW